jgi:hypothetical protein
MRRFRAYVGEVTLIEPSDDDIIRPGDFAFKFDGRGMYVHDLYSRYVEDFPTLTFNIVCYRDDVNRDH